jgi:hypothetical protein
MPDSKSPQAQARARARAVRREQQLQDFIRAAREAGHELQVERPGSVLEVADTVIASCTCGRYRSVPGAFEMARNQWRSHAYGTMYGSRPHKLKVAS